MDRKLGLTGSVINIASVALFAAAMLFGALSVCYIGSIFIAWSLTLMCGAFFVYRRSSATAAGIIMLVFCGMYALCNTAVYFIQVTTVANEALSAQAASLLDYSQMGMMFNMDMLGYCLMAITTFFAGLTIDVRSKADKWLRGLLMVHGVFAVSCFIIPMTGMFQAGGPEWIGTAILEFWCAYFLPVGILSVNYFKKR